MNETFHAIAAKYKDEIVQTASELIQINSQSLHEKELAEYVAAKMRKLGYDDVTVDAYGSVFGTVKGTGGGSSVMLNCHMDVVDAGRSGQMEASAIQRGDRRGTDLGPRRLGHQGNLRHPALCAGHAP